MKSTFVQIIMAACLTTASAGGAGAADLKAAYLYSLSDFNGAKEYSAAKIALDDAKNEIYAMSGEAMTIFNSSGMEVFRLDFDPALGVVHDVAVHPDGDLFLLVLKDRQTQIVRCNFRGEAIAPVTVTELPGANASFVPNRIFLRDGRLYLANLGEMQVVVTDLEGTYREHIDLAAKIGLSDKERIDSGIGGFSLDREANILFTLPAMAKVYRLSKEGELKSFGRRGSGPGKFGVVSGVAADKDGNLLVADTLRCVVMVFDKDFKLIREFGFRGFGPGNLIGPNEILVDGNNRAYISQIRKRGVSVFQISNS
jgi:hypothetical protein